MNLITVRHRGFAILTLIITLGGMSLLPQAADARQSQDRTPNQAGTTGIFDSVAVGAGRTTLPDELFPEEFVGDEVLVTLFAYAPANQAAGGNFSVIHTEPDGELVAELHASVECFRIEGDYAIVGGRITSAEFPGVPEGAPPIGGVAAVVVEDGGHAGDTMVWSFGGSDVELNCDEIPAQTAVPVEGGNFFIIN